MEEVTKLDPEVVYFESFIRIYY